MTKQVKKYNPKLRKFVIEEEQTKKDDTNILSEVLSRLLPEKQKREIEEEIKKEDEAIKNWRKEIKQLILDDLDTLSDAQLEEISKKTFELRLKNLEGVKR